MAQKYSASPAALSTKSGGNWNNALDRTSTPRTQGSGLLFVATDADREEVQQGANVIGHGDFQRLIFGFTIVAQMVLLCHSNVLALITDPVDHWCRPPRELSGMSVARWKNVGIPADEVGRFSQCRVYVRPGATPNDTETVPCDSWDYDEVEAHRSARSYWNLVCHRSWLLSLGNGVFMSGALIVVPFMGYLADTEGRKPVIIVASFVLMTTAIASCFAEAFPLYLALIFVNSACASTVHIITVILMFEVAPLQYRTFYMGLGNSLGVLFVEMLFVFVTAVRIGWFPLQLLVVAPTLLLLSATFAVHESPMWLLSMSRLKEAEEVIYTAAKVNGVSRIRAKQAFERIKFEMNKASVPYSPVAPTALLVPGSLRGRAVAVFVTTFTAMLAYYSLTWSHRLGGSSNLVVRVISVAALAPTYLALYLALNTLGRLQLMLVLFTLLGGVSGLYGIATYAEPHEVAYALAIAAKCLASALIPTNYLYMAELFPSSVRSAVMCGAYTCGRVGAVFASVLSLLQEVDREDVGFAVLAVLVFGGLLVLLSLPETTVRGATDVAVTNMDGKRRDLLDVMQTTLAPKRKKRRRGRRMSSALAVLPVKQALSSPKWPFPR
ncbi:solute carrier family 22 member 6-like [Dermacentor variabilis]|uniref:solute carrier family 22 member 6-like n=1 Tax=Dermacentor variabilis TaxID=34621 RepID=UPI003F5B5ADD